MPLILVFKTNVQNSEHVDILRLKLTSLLPGVKWNFDLDDCDKILRVENLVESNTVISILLESGFYCEELLD